MCILDIPKVCLYEFHHEYNLIYRIECDDVYEQTKCDVTRFDTSDCSTDNVYGIPFANKKMSGLMKDENNAY